MIRTSERGSVRPILPTGPRDANSRTKVMFNIMPVKASEFDTFVIRRHIMLYRSRVTCYDIALGGRHSQLSRVVSQFEG